MTLRRYERPRETATATVEPPTAPIPFENAAAALSRSVLSPGSRRLLLGLLRTGATRWFPGGIGIEYAGLLKTAVRPEDVGGHVAEAADHLRDRRVDLLFVPGMSGYPVGAMYAYAAGLPAVLLKKQKHAAEAGYPAGSFVIPSYTGDDDVVMSADLDAVRDIVAGIVARQIAGQADRDEIAIEIRCAGCDDIIDKGTMAYAITESAPTMLSQSALEVITRHRDATGDMRNFSLSCRFVTWVAPLVKTYNGPTELLMNTFGVDVFGGLSVSSVHLDPPSIGVEGIGVLEFRRS